MLAARTVCAMLCAEHSLIRQTWSSLALLAETLRRKDLVHPVQEALHVRHLLGFLHSFHFRFHHEKERHHVLARVEGRSLEADRLVQRLDRLHRHERALWAESTALVNALEAGCVSVAARLAQTLRRHREIALRALRCEETELFPLARRLLDEDTWSRVVSDVSLVTRGRALAFPEFERRG